MRRTFMQTALLNSSVPFRTKNIFSTHYLNDLLKQLPEWKQFGNGNKNAFIEICRIKEKKETILENLTEPQLEEEFIRPILRILGHTFDVQKNIPNLQGCPSQPDYAFFKSEEELDSIREKPETDYFKFAISIGEAKRWDANLDKKRYIDGKLEMNPSLQISTYLRFTNVRWGILTNGRLWRLYCNQTSFNVDTYYEIDLINLIQGKNLEDFKYFYLFFRREAFIIDDSGKCFLDMVLEESTQYSKELEEDVRENLYEVLKILAKGFLDFPENCLNENNLEEIYDNCLTYLYRLLFVLYSEAKGLLPTHNNIYKNYSLEKLKNEIKEKIDSPLGSLLPNTDVYWNKIKNLFYLINNGSEELRIPRDDLFIPPYNGGLLDPEKHPFLEKYKVGDCNLAHALDLLTRSRNKNGGENVFIDYSTLSIRHLGSIYEGLLEYKLRIAKEPMILTKVKGKEKWIPEGDYKGKKRVPEIDQKKKVDKGDIYLIIDRGERKATGSYYQYLRRYFS